MAADMVLPCVFLIHNGKAPCPILVVLGVSAVMDSLAHGGGKDEVDTVKAVSVDDLLGAGIKALTVIVFVNGSLDSTGAVAVFEVAFTPFVLFVPFRSFLEGIEIQWLMLRHCVHLLSFLPT